MRIRNLRIFPIALNELLQCIILLPKATRRYGGVLVHLFLTNLTVGIILTLFRHNTNIDIEIEEMK